MALTIRRFGLSVIGVFLGTQLCITRCFAQDAVTPSRIHAETGAQVLMEELLANSVTARGLVERLNASDLLVYVRISRFADKKLSGRLGFLDSHDPGRRLLIEIAPVQPKRERLVALAHELEHALEIAELPDVVDPHTLSLHYERLAETTSRRGDPETFETAAARYVGRTVRRELSDAAQHHLFVGHNEHTGDSLHAEDTHGAPSIHSDQTLHVGDNSQ